MQVSETKITRKFAQHALNGLEMVKAKAFRRFKEATGANPAFYCYTFLGDDYERGMFRLVCFDIMRKKVVLSAPQDSFEAAMKEIITLNPHLILEVDQILVTDEDVLSLRKSASFRVLQPIPSE